MLKTKFTEQAGIEYPIICGAMFPSTSPELVAAASEAGGIGIVQPMSLIYIRNYDLRKALQYIRTLTLKPYGMNLILVPGYEKRLKTWCEIAIEEGCRFFITALGKPTWVVEKVHAAGGIVYHDVIKRDHALKAIDVGIDGLICVNNRAGGHLGTLSAIDLYHEVNDLGKPLICAGGIGEESDFVKALKMGYAGVQMRTRFIATAECDESDEYKQAIINATENDIVITNKMDGVPSSVINTPYVKKTGLKTGPIQSWLLKYRLTKKLMRRWIAVGIFLRLKIEKKSGSSRWLQAGKSVASIHKIEQVKDIIQRFVKSVE